MNIDLTILSNTSLMRLYEAFVKISNFDNENTKAEYTKHAEEVRGFYQAKTGADAKALLEFKWSAIKSKQIPNK